jgi:hypothetical protein
VFSCIDLKCSFRYALHAERSGKSTSYASYSPLVRRAKDGTPTSAVKKKRGHPFKERFLADLLRELGEPTPARPSTRCFSDRRLRAVIGGVRDGLHAQQVRGATRFSASELLAYLTEVHLAHKVPTEGIPGHRGGPPAFYVLDIGRPTDGPRVAPLELLLAHKPEGFVCYFTALAFHGLTTQQPAFHHVAVPSAPSSREVQETAIANVPESPPVGHAGSRRRPNALGEPVFTYDGVSYYVTRRNPRLAPGVQTRHLDSRTLIRITTREQTLLDTLHRPRSCGGPEVVFEAWKTGLPEIDETLLARYIETMGYAPSARRTGAMLSLLGHQPRSDALRTILDRFRNCADEPIPLLAGIEYPRLDAAWSIRTP